MRSSQVVKESGVPPSFRPATSLSSSSPLPSPSLSSSPPPPSLPPLLFPLFLSSSSPPPLSPSLPPLLPLSSSPFSLPPLLSLSSSPPPPSLLPSSSFLLPPPPSFLFLSFLSPPPPSLPPLLPLSSLPLLLPPPLFLPSLPLFLSSSFLPPLLLFLPSPSLSLSSPLSLPSSSLFPFLRFSSPLYTPTSPFPSLLPLLSPFYLPPVFPFSFVLPLSLLPLPILLIYTPLLPRSPLLLVLPFSSFSPSPSFSLVLPRSPSFSLKLPRSPSFSLVPLSLPSFSPSPRSPRSPSPHIDLIVIDGESGRLRDPSTARSKNESLLTGSPVLFTSVLFVPAEPYLALGAASPQDGEYVSILQGKPSPAPRPRPPRHRQQGERAGPRDLLLGPRPLSDHIHLADGSHRSRRPDAPPSPSPSERLSSSSWDKTSRDKACVFILPLNSLAEDKLRQPSLLLSATSSYEAACARGISSNLTVEAKRTLSTSCYQAFPSHTDGASHLSPLPLLTSEDLAIESGRRCGELHVWETESRAGGFGVARSSAARTPPTHLRWPDHPRAEGTAAAPSNSP
ncbi:hypothetical protein C7M84_010254 [Penaeus vannamei]|uniref:Uncharacterized protein n=1 Tax=Penaeus vannamei TaxID=6689 RepID=A0A3R7Q8Q6_PENVA|nr:hypothetical protein C7M84_010254 [Penaeus vannamei]